MPINIIYQNVRGLRTKLDGAFENVLNTNAEIICLTETWLNGHILSSELVSGDFVTHRRDRDYSRTGTKNGGGSAIIHSNKLITTRMYDFETDIPYLEDIWLKIQLPDRCLFLCVVYITPCANNSVLYETFYEKASANVMEINSENGVMIIGDFNLSQIHWMRHHSDRVVAINPVNGSGRDFLTFLNYTNLSQHNLIQNKDGRILDLVLASANLNEVTVTESTHMIAPIDHYHPPLEIILNCGLSSLREKHHGKFNFRKADYDTICAQIDLIDWSFIRNNDINQSMATFYEKINTLIGTFVPIKGRKSKYPFWFDYHTIRALKRKDRYHKKWMKTRRSSDYALFSNERAGCKNLISKCHTQYVERLQLNVRKNVKLFWAFTKNKKQTNTYPAQMSFENNTSSEPQTISTYFASHFRKTYMETSTESVALGNMANVNSDVIPNKFHVHDVECIISKLDENKNGGPDGLPNYFIKKVCRSISLPLVLLFDKSLEQGIFPQALKYAYISPVFKKGNKQQVENYRPVCLLNTIAIVFEKLILRRIEPVICDKISNKQHGFMPKKSTGTNLTEYTNYIACALDVGDSVNAIYTDFSKAFDSVDHGLLLDKLAGIGVGGAMLKFLASYISGRSLKVVFCGTRSQAFIPTTAVPQGSVLGPILFNAFINDLTGGFKCNFLLYADDLKLFTRIRSQVDCQKLQSDVDTLYHWCEQNKIKLNIDKCNSMIFSSRAAISTFTYTINNVSLQQVDSVNDLGVIFDRKLNFHNHVDKMVNKSYKMLGFLTRIMKKFRNRDCFNLLYNTLVRPHLEYCSTVWNPHCQGTILKVERVQKKYTRHLNFKLGFEYVEYGERLRQHRMLSLESRRTLADLRFLHGTYHSPNSDCHAMIVLRPNTYRNRHNLTFYPPFARTNFKKFRSPIVRAQNHHIKIASNVDINESVKSYSKLIFDAVVKLQATSGWNISRSLN